MPVHYRPNPSASHAEQTSRRQSASAERRIWIKSYVGIPLAVGFLGMSVLLVGLRTAPLPVDSLVNPTQIADRTGQTLSNWTAQGTHAQFAPLSTIPKALQQATLAVEDENFYHHSAFSVTGLGRALWVDIRHGHIEEGGSTITQQLARTLFLSQNRTIGRKFREALYAMQLEMHESKDAILAEYLNYVYYGYGAYGAAQAAEVYFGKPLAHLNLAECAMLAGLPQAPSAYAPTQHFEAAKERQRIVLQRLVDVGYLTRQQAMAVFAMPIQITHTNQSSLRAPYFTEVAVDEAKRRYRLATDDLYQGGIHIMTTVDPMLQQAAERAITRSLAAHPGLQAALVALDPQTGAVRALVGGRDYQSSPYNRVFAERQPGSTFKAILYTAALQNGWTPASQVESVETTFRYDGNQSYTVRDFGAEYANRPLTLRAALARSDNVYAVTANLDVGPGVVINTAHEMGISAPMQPYPSLALGVFPVSPLQMATAYATLANGGYRVTPYAVSQVSRSTADAPLLRAEPPRVRVVSPQISFQMTDLLHSVLAPHGTGYPVHTFLHQPAAAKTGTTDTDGWMVGYTPATVCAVWVGYDDNRPISLSEAHLASHIWAQFMGTAEQHAPTAWYQPPAGLTARLIDPLTAKLATDTCASTELDYFQPGTEPTLYCPLHPASKPSGLVPRAGGIVQWLRRWL